MSAHLDLIGGITDAVGVAWPEVVDNGIFVSAEFSTIPFERFAESGTLPVCVMDIELEPSSEWGNSNDTEEGPIYVYFIANDSVSLATLIAKLEALRLELWDNQTSAAGIQLFPKISYSISLPINQYFIAQQRPFFGGAVIFDAVLVSTERQ